MSRRIARSAFCSWRRWPGACCSPICTARLQHTRWYVKLFGTPRPPPNIESLLFGSLFNVGPYDVWLAISAAAVVLLVFAALFKEIIFYAFQETVSQVFGVRVGFIHYLMLTLLSVAIVLTVRLAGIVLVTALLVIPGATANLLSRRLGARATLFVAGRDDGRRRRIDLELGSGESFDRAVHRRGAVYDVCRGVCGAVLATTADRCGEEQHVRTVALIATAGLCKR